MFGSKVKSKSRYKFAFFFTIDDKYNGEKRDVIWLSVSLKKIQFPKISEQAPLKNVRKNMKMLKSNNIKI